MFERLSANANSGESDLALKRPVVNLSDHQLSTDETSVLAKGEKFAVVPKRLPVEEIISNIEAGIRGLPVADADEIRMEGARILKDAKLLKSNLTGGESRTLRELRAAEDIVILPADKGSATVVMITVDYKNKIHDLLDPNIYKKLSKDPTGAVVCKIRCW